MSLEIVLDNPQAVFFAGQTVSGRVIFKSTTDESTKGLLIKFEGKASVHWTESRSSSHHSAGRHAHSHTVSYDSNEVFFDSRTFLFGDGQTEVTLPPGEVSYPFYIQLPPNQLYSSFVGEFGKVEYTLKAVMKRSFWKFDHKDKRMVIVHAMVDLNLNSMAAVPGEWRCSKSFCCLCCASGPLSLTVKMPKTGYCPGETIFVETEVNNASNKEINDLSLEIVQESTFFAQGKQKKTSIPIASVRRCQSISACDSDCWRVEVKIPAIPPSNLGPGGGCRIINVEYFVKIVAHVPGIAFNLKQLCPILIGTIPFHSPEFDGGGNTVFPSAPPLETLWGS